MLCLDRGLLLREQVFHCLVESRGSCQVGRPTASRVVELVFDVLYLPGGSDAGSLPRPGLDFGGQYHGLLDQLLNLEIVLDGA